MFVAESEWLACELAKRAPGELSPILNIGSSTRAFREAEQPWIETRLFAPLRARGIEIIHLDVRAGEGIDIRADILADTDFPRLKALGARAILCCNILEHVTAPQELAQRCIEIVGPGGLIFVTVPYSYPRHRDPIDTLYRPAPDDLRRLFGAAEMIRSEIVDVGESYRDQVKKRPWILLRHVLRFPFPFVGFEDWRHSMRKIYWLFADYKVSCAVFAVPSAGPRVDSGVPRP